tara:strand:- start:265 stop:450 length:186 start_codon:yes stop_codon:yes gene_type:complete
MPAVTINGKEYQTENLSENAQNQFVSLVFVQNEIKRLEAQLAAFKTAEIAYSKALENELPT